MDAEMTYLDFAMGGFGKEILERMAQPIPVERCNHEPEHNQNSEHNTGFEAGLWQSERHDGRWTKTSCLRASSQTKQSKAMLACHAMLCTLYAVWLMRIPPARVFISALRTHAEKLLHDGATSTLSAILPRPFSVVAGMTRKMIGLF